MFVFRPSKGLRVPARRLKVLWLEDISGELRRRDSTYKMPAIVMVNAPEFAERFSGLREVVGVTPAGEFELERCGFQRVHRGRLVYQDIEPAVYEVECMLSVHGVGWVRHSVYVEYDDVDGFLFLSFDELLARFRPTGVVDFGEVRAAVARYDWLAAERWARWMSSNDHRRHALRYMRRERARVEAILPELHGAKKKLSYASDIRQRILSEMHELAGRERWRSRVNDARPVLLRQRSCDYWLRSQFKLDNLVEFGRQLDLMKARA